jgi:hypothetical protein
MSLIVTRRAACLAKPSFPFAVSLVRNLLLTKPL